MKFQIYSYKEAREIVKQIKAKPVTTTEDGVTTCEIAFPFKLSKGKYIILLDKSFTSAATMKTKYEMRFGSIIVKGESQEDCLLKIIARLTGEVLKYDSNK